MMLIDKVKGYIHSHQLLQSGETYIVALSGGADSVALLLILKELGYSVEAAHCNFNLRGEESKRDEDFCVSLCASRGIKLHRAHFDTFEYAHLHKVSIEMAARNLRYHYFDQLRLAIGAKGICVAHHLNDNVETLLLNLIRGTGIQGLTGMASRNSFVLRPLLDVRHEEIREYLHSINQAFVIDSTNLEDDVLRNKIRLNVIPMLEGLNPAVVDNIAKTIHNLVDAKVVLDDVTKQFMSHGVAVMDSYSSCPSNDVNTNTLSDSQYLSIDILKLLASPSARFLLYELIKGYHFNSSQIDDIVSKLKIRNSEGDFCSRTWFSNEYEAIIDRQQLIIIKKSKEKFREMSIPEPGVYILPTGQKLNVEPIPIKSFKLEKDKSVACLDAEKAAFPLKIRAVQNGDRFIPFGMSGTKLVSDYLTNIKASVIQRRNQLVITEQNDHIIWLVKERPDNRFRISPSTKNILRLHIL